MASPRNPSKRFKKQLKSLRSGLKKAQKTAKRQVKSLRSGLKKEKKESLGAKKVSRRAVKRLRSGLKKEKKELQKVKRTARKAASKTAVLSGEMSLLKKELLKLKSRKLAKKQLNEYNLFMRKHLRAGETFRQAVSAWKKFKRLLNKRRPSAYNHFIAAQLSTGKTFKHAVSAWKEFKSGRKPRARIRIVKKVIVRRAKPKRIVIIKRQRPKKIVKVRRIDVPRPFFPVSEINSLVSKTVSETRQSLAFDSASNSEEALALRIVRLYFEQIASLGFKRSLDLDEIINAYFYALLRVKRSCIEFPEIVEAIKKNKIKKTGF